jgi:hypothetical protein
MNEYTAILGAGGLLCLGWLCWEAWKLHKSEPIDDEDDTEHLSRRSHPHRRFEDHQL